MRLVPGLHCVLLTAAATTSCSPAVRVPTAHSSLLISPQTAFAMRVVADHNVMRAAAAVSPVTWDAQLAASAATSAGELARTDRFAHSAAEARQDQGENLWMGTRGAYTIDEMVGGWLVERSKFHAGTFPHVSKTGNWEDVGHYTQIIWPTSVRIGCAIRSSARFDYLVCRYGSAGNVFGESVGVRRTAIG